MHEVTQRLFFIFISRHKHLIFYLKQIFCPVFLMLGCCASTYRKADLSCCMLRWGALAFPHTAPWTRMLRTPRGVRNRADMLAAAPRGLSHKSPEEGQGEGCASLLYFTFLKLGNVPCHLELVRDYGVTHGYQSWATSKACKVCSRICC